jgi:sirohydrochlorin ferrochelatase
VPLLLTAAYHGKVDVPAEVTAARAEGLRIEVDVADVLGPRGRDVDPLLLCGLARRLDEAAAVAGAGGGDPAGSGLDAVVLAAAGTRDSAARATVGRAAAALGLHLGVPCTVAYASAAPPAAGVSVARFRAAGAERVGLASYFLAPGVLYDATVRSALRSGAAAVAAPLGDAAEVVRLVCDRVEVLSPGRTVAHAA